jgi:hypothetical protein
MLARIVRRVGRRLRRRLASEQGVLVLAVFLVVVQDGR